MVKDTWNKFTKNEKIIFSVLLIILVAMLWMGVNVSNLKEIVHWLIGV